MGLRFLLDTNIVSEPYKASPSRALLARLGKHGGEVAIASTTWFELTSGVENMPEGKRKTARRDMLVDVQRAVPILPYDERAAGWHGMEYVRLMKLGKAPGSADGQIAAIAWANALALVTANVKHFRAFDGLRVENWMRAR
jgi:tRNA(fMet)-specific endonuclease VapC